MHLEDGPKRENRLKIHVLSFFKYRLVFKCDIVWVEKSLVEGLLSSFGFGEISFVLFEIGSIERVEGDETSDMPGLMRRAIEYLSVH
jgi:hypothetical protein